MLDFNSEGTRVFVVISSVGVVVTTVLIWPKVLLQFNKLERRYQLPSPAPQEKLYLLLVHFMLFHEIYRVTKKIWNEAYFYCFSNIYKNQTDFFEHPIQWLPWVIVGVCVLSVVLFKSEFTPYLKNLIQSLWENYRIKTSDFLLTSLGLVFLFSSLVFSFFSLIHYLKTILKYFEQGWPPSFWEPVTLLGMFFLILILSGIGVISNFGLYKKIYSYFRPNFYYHFFNYGISFLNGILFLVKIQRGDFKTSTGFFFWFDRLFYNYYFIPACYLGLAWLFYRWSWFEKAKVKEDQTLPVYMSQEKFWWGVCGILAAILFLDLIKDMGWLFWGPGFKKSVMD